MIHENFLLRTIGHTISRRDFLARNTVVVGAVAIAKNLAAASGMLVTAYHVLNTILRMRTKLKGSPMRARRDGNNWRRQTGSHDQAFSRVDSARSSVTTEVVKIPRSLFDQLNDAVRYAA